MNRTTITRLFTSVGLALSLIVGSATAASAHTIHAGAKHVSVTKHVKPAGEQWTHVKPSGEQWTNLRPSGEQWTGEQWTRLKPTGEQWTGEQWTSSTR